MKTTSDSQTQMAQSNGEHGSRTLAVPDDTRDRSGRIMNPENSANSAPPRQERVDFWHAPAVITPSNFIYKRLSNWAFKPAVACSQACRCGHVPSAATFNKCSEHGIETLPLRASVGFGGRRSGLVGVKPASVDLSKLRLRGFLKALIPVAIISSCGVRLPAAEATNVSTNLHALHPSSVAVSREQLMQSIVSRILIINEESRNLFREAAYIRDHPSDTDFHRAAAAKSAHPFVNVLYDYGYHFFGGLFPIVYTAFVVLFCVFIHSIFGDLFESLGCTFRNWRAKRK